ncbi:diguanylate cyclase [Hahella sp. SMD15-11]|uniref:diguanylate cyclase n=1 Tax=Thermohahella caldifontis TaxID=3142973 RepID=A0AB39V128_9GAMM
MRRLALHRCLWMWLTVVIWAGSAQAAEVRTLSVSPEDDYYNLGPQLVYFEDPSGKINFFDVLFRHNVPFWEPVNQEVPSFGYSSSTYWFAVEIENPDYAPNDWLLEIAYPVLDWVDVYITEGERMLHQYRVGDHLVFNSRPWVHPNFVMPITMDPLQKITVFIKVQTGTSVQLPIRLWNPTAFDAHNQRVILINGIYYGFMIVMAIYNLFLFFSIRQVRYLLYVGFICGFSLFQFTLQGYAFQHLWPENIRLNELALPLSLGATLFFMAQFIRNFLQLKQHAPLGNLFFNLCALIALIILAATPFAEYRILIYGLILLALPLNGGALVYGIKRSLAADRAAQYFTLAWFSSFVGAILLALSKLEILPRNAITEHALQIGTALEVVLISFALGEYINMQRREREEARRQRLHFEQLARKAQEEALSAERKYSAKLEEQVSERTQALQEAMSRLEEANRKLERQSHIDELTSVYNRRFFNQRYDMEFRRAQREQVPLSVIMIDIDHFKNLNDTYGHLFGDQCLQAVALALKGCNHRPADTVARYGGEEFVILLPNTPREGARVVAERIRSEVEHLRIRNGNEEIQVTISLGVASAVPDARMTPARLLDKADSALYLAKESGRNQVQVAA